MSTDRETIRGWAEKHGAVPVRHEEGAGEYRFVGETETGETHERVDWNEFFSELDEGDYVVIHHGEGADETFEVAGRREALTRMDLEREEVEDRLLAGETVRSEITETTVVERVIVEHATVESELVDTEIVDQNVVDVDLLRRECTDCELVEDRGVEADELFDTNRYFESVGATEYAAGEPMGALGPEDELPYHVELGVEEAWAVTREIGERLTVESRVVEEDVTETDTIEDRDIDVEGLHRTIVESDVLDVDMSAEEVMTEYDVETEMDEGETILTYFDRQRVVEDEVVDRRRLRADVVEGELLGMETVHSEDVAETMPREEGAATGATEAEPTATGTDGTDTTATTDAEVEADVAEPGAVMLTDDEIGKSVVDSTGEEVGMITDVDDGGGMMYVNPEPGIAERIKAALDWGSSDEDYPVDAQQVARITDDAVELKGTDEMEESARR
ncbi:hypothetical protein [Halorarum salinum]|nr:hypothetical protein [Halobaculum salinum]